MTNAEYMPYCGGNPAISENAIAWGSRTAAPVKPANTSLTRVERFDRRIHERKGKTASTGEFRIAHFGLRLKVLGAEVPAIPECGRKHSFLGWTVGEPTTDGNASR